MDEVIQQPIDLPQANEPRKSFKDLVKRISTKLIWLLIFIPIGIYFHFGLEHLTKFETADEFYWYSQGRIQQYWFAMAGSDWKNTMINDKPGITLAMISGTALFRDTSPVPDVTDGNRQLATYPLDQIEKAHYNYRLPILIFNGIISLYLYWVVRKMTKNRWMGLIAATLILMQPILIGISQIINPDALFWSFAVALLFTFLAFLETGQVILAIFSVLLMGLTLASKYVGIIFFPFLVFALGVYVVFHAATWEEEGLIVWKKILWRSIVYLLTIFGGIGIFALLMPATILDLKYLARGTYDFPGMQFIFRLSVGVAIFFILDAAIFKSWLMIKLSHYGKYPRIVATKLLFLGILILLSLTLIDWMYQLNLFQLFGMPFEGGKIAEFSQLLWYKQMLLEVRPLVFASTPLVLGLVGALWLVSLVKNWKCDWLLFTLTSFIPIFFVAVIKQGLLIHVRYSIVLFPILATIAAILLVEFFSWGYLKHVPKILLFILVVVGSWQSIKKVEPFYFNYTNDYLPKNFALVDGWGFGGYEAAQYLNSLSNAQDLKVVTDYTGVCQFFVGRCVRYTNLLRPHFDSRWRNQSYDYFVMSKKGFRRYGLQEEYADFYTQEPVWKLEINGRPDNYLKILSSHDSSSSNNQPQTSQPEENMSELN